ncbi:hypothetical protein E4L98_28510, partial [Duganella callida]
MEMTLPAPAPTRRQAARPRDSGFFAYHGWLAPGIRLFRAIRFPAKSLWISVAFMLPLAFALSYLVVAEREQLASAESELEGLRYLAPLNRFIQQAQQARKAAASGADAAAPLA